MAKAKAGPLVYAIRGRVGESVFSIWKGVQVIRALGFKAWDPSAKQTALVNLLTEATIVWNDLTSAERAAWDAQALKQKWRPNNSRPRGGVRNLVPENQSLGSGRMIFMGRYVNAKRHGWNPVIVWGLLREEFDNLDDWVVGGGNGLTEINPEGFCHQHPDAFNNIIIDQTLGGWGPTQYTFRWHTKFTALDTRANVTYYRISVEDGVHWAMFDISSDEINYYNGAAYEPFPLVTDTGIDYYWHVRFDGVAHSAKIWRSLDLITWTYITEYVNLRNNPAGPGDVYIQQIRGAVPDIDVRTDYFYISNGLYQPTEIFPLPDFGALPEPPKITTVVYAAGTCTISFTLPPGFDPSSHRVGAWLYGGYTALGEIYRQWINYQTNPAVLTIAFTTAFVTGNGEQDLVDLEDTFLYVQLYTCDSANGRVSCGSATKEVAIE